MPANKTVQNPQAADPKSQGPKPEENAHQDKIPYPGLSGDMEAKPDHGEESYRGLGRLVGPFCSGLRVAPIGAVGGLPAVPGRYVPGG